MTEHWENSKVHTELFYSLENGYENEKLRAKQKAMDKFPSPHWRRHLSFFDMYSGIISGRWDIYTEKPDIPVSEATRGEVIYE